MKEFSAFLFEYREHIGFLFFIIATSFVIFLYIRYLKKEHHKLIKFCQEHDYSLIEKSYNIPNCPYKFSILTDYDYQGYSKFYDIISGKISGVDFSVMDFCFKSGKYYKIYSFWILTKPNYTINSFNIKPHSNYFFSFGKDDNCIRFIEDKPFSNTFDLTGFDDQQLRKLFNANLRNAFLNCQTANFEYQSARGYFLILLPKELDLDTKIKYLNQFINLYLNLLARYK